ncbi:MAG: flagellar hook-basal body complex protein FliE, partial [Candidatus Goldbacteria bacterium]|nr:flagellar hook-basal body complex protein FliE [Candidatus Goldiibacteriota bacterium]
MVLNHLSGIEGIGGLKGIGIPESILTPPVQQPAAEKFDFGQLLQMAIKSINETSVNANEAIEKLAAGQNIELHNVVLAAQK